MTIFDPSLEQPQATSQGQTPGGNSSSPYETQEAILLKEVRQRTRNIPMYQNAIPFPAVVVPSASDLLDAKNFVDEWMNSTDPTNEEMQRQLRGMSNTQRWNILNLSITHSPEEYSSNSQLIKIVHNTITSLFNNAEFSALSLREDLENVDYSLCIKHYFSQESFTSLMEMYVNPDEAFNLFSKLVDLIGPLGESHTAELIAEFLENCPQVATLEPTPLEEIGGLEAIKICYPRIATRVLT